MLVRSGERWDALSTTSEGDESDETAAWRHVHDQVGVETTVVRSGGTLQVDGRTIRPFLLEVETDVGQAGGYPIPAVARDDTAEEGRPDAENDSTDGGVPAAGGDESAGDDGRAEADRELGQKREWEWAHPPAILRRETVPGLWRAYERVGPTLRTVVADDEHGSTWLSIRAVEALRDRAGLLAVRSEANDPADWSELADLADRLRTARPGMAAVENRVNRAMAAATAQTATAVETGAVDAVDRAVDADREAADEAADRVADRAVVTLSRSETVLRTLRLGDPEVVYITESRPAREGVDVAEELARSGERVVLHTDAAVGTVLSERATVAVVGADAVRPDGTVVNKTGTRTLAVAAEYEDVPLYVVAASDKVATGPLRVEAGSSDTLYDGEAPVETYDPTFDVTPPDLVDGVVTERGLLSTDEVGDLAEELAALADWDGTEKTPDVSAEWGQE